MKLLRLTVRGSEHCWDWLCDVRNIVEIGCALSFTLLTFTACSLSWLPLRLAVCFPEHLWDWMCVVLSRAEINCTLWWILLRFAVHCFELCWDWLCAVCQGPCWDWMCAVRNRAEIDCVLSWTVIYQLKLQISLCISNNLAQHLLKKLFFLSRSLEE